MRGAELFGERKHFFIKFTSQGMITIPTPKYSHAILLNLSPLHIILVISKMWTLYAILILQLHISKTNREEFFLLFKLNSTDQSQIWLRFNK